MTFGEMLREYRRRAGKTLQDAAAAVGLSVVYVSEIERGKKPPIAPSRIAILAALYQVNAADLLMKAAEERRSLPFGDATAAQMRALSGMARGGVTDEQWESIVKILEEGGEENDGVK